MAKTNFFTKAPKLNPRMEWQPGTPRGYIPEVNFHGPRNVTMPGEVGPVVMTDGINDMRVVHPGRKRNGTVKP